jgi:cytochrome c-type biogenesis protein CcmH/NrfG
MSALQAVTIAAVVLPALVFAVWPLARRGSARPDAAGAPGSDRRLELTEEKTAVYRALKELTFDHEAGHLSDDDYQALSARYERRAAELLAELDLLPPAAAAPAPPREAPATAPRATWTRHPATLAAGALVLVVFGVVVGVNVGRFTEPADPAMAPGPGPMAGPPPAMGPVAGSPPAGGSMPPVAGMEPGKPIPPEMLAGMLRAARQSLTDGRYPEAIAAYQAVLKRDPKNVDAMTHLGLIVAIGGHADAAIETFDKALLIDPEYAPAHLYRGQVLYEVKQDYSGAVAAWEKFLALVPAGDEHDRVVALVNEARAKRSK